MVTEKIKKKKNCAFFFPPFHIVKICHLVPVDEAISRVENAIVEFLGKISTGQKVEILGKDMKANPVLFLRILSILDLCHNLLINGRTILQRDIYYELMPLVEGSSGQECWDRAIRIITKALKISRISLHITPGVRGFITGRLKILEESGKWVDCSTLGPSGRPIHGSMSDLNRTIRSDAKYILAIEKEGVYEELSKAKMFNMIPSILITGKGIPDVATRAFTSRLSVELNIPVLGICDWNPGGLTVMMVFRNGSNNNAEGALYPCPNFHWLGLLAEDVDELQNQSVPMTMQDKTRLESHVLAAEKTPLAFQQQLEIMQEKKIRVELQALRFGNATLLAWVLKKMIKKSWVSL